MLMQKILRLFRKPDPVAKKSYDLPPFLRSTPLPATEGKKVPDKCIMHINLGEQGSIYVYEREDGSTYSSVLRRHKK